MRSTKMTSTTYGLTNNYKQVNTRYDASHEVLWTFMNQKSMIPCYNGEIISELTRHHKEIENTAGILHADGNIHSIKYSVAASLTPDVFNLGGQLVLIRELALNRQREALMDYATKALDVLAQRTFRFNIPSLITITLLQGQTLGAGFEAALTSDVIIAERKSVLGFPEIMFNLFPGMGAYSLVARKVGTKIADELILGGKLYTAEEAHALGLVDVLVEDGQGEKAVYDWIEKNKRISNGYLAIQKAKNRYNPVTYAELTDITHIWLDAALKLNDRDFKVMERFIRSQEKRYLQVEMPVDNVIEMKRTA
jgi:DSF synthase